MKIVSQSADELVLNEGSTSGIVVGVVLVIAGALVAYFVRQSQPMALWIGLAIMIVGILVVLFSSSITVSANRKSGSILYRKKRLIGGQNSEYSIGDVFRIETRKQWQMNNSQAQQNQGGVQEQPTLVAQSVIVFKDGRELALDHQKNSSSMSAGSVVLMDGQGAETAIAAQVASFLNVPFQEIGPPNMGIQINI
jgi:hypothetical protein